MFRKIVNKYKSLNNQLKASVWFLICGFLGKGVSIITTPIFTRILSTEEYGQYSVFYSWFGIVSVIMTLNLFSGVFTQGMVKYEERKTEYASSLQGLCLILVVFWSIVYCLFNEFWNSVFSLTTIQMIAMLIMVWTSAVFQFWSVSQRVDLKYRTLVIVTIIVTIAKPVIGIILVLNSTDKVTARIIGLMMVELLAYVWMFFFQMIKGKKIFVGEFWKHALKFNIPLIPHYLSMTVLNSADRIMISNMCDAGKAGIYNLAYSISQIMTVFNTALMQTIEPWLYKKIKAKEIREMSKVAMPAFMLVAFVNWLLILFAPEVIKVFAPVSYHDAIWVIPPIAMSIYFMFLYTFFAVFEFYYEKTQYIMVATTSGAVLNIVLNYIFIPMYGYYAAGYTTLVCYIIYVVFHYIFMRKMCNQYLDGAEPYEKKYMFGVTFIFIMVSFMIMMTYKINWLRYTLILIIVCALVIRRKKISKLVTNYLNIRKQ